ncbi:PPX1 [Candida margitis]|uniref:PPX1 n=1 Tax=Candida margitis TaxID=1775924 RepID=UPI00222747E7|nr:PPX1 [Candida margitis]KAI5969460.1 PPX1 [Candida margitis]
MSLRSYLVNLKQALSSRTFKTPYRIVTGNQSADMDSVVSAITFAYLTYSLKTPNEYIIPLIDIPREDFALRRDINKLLSYHNITEDLLYFVEDFDKFLDKSTSIDLSLVDHNGLQGVEINKGFDGGQVNVEAIIDHHADEGHFENANPRIIRTCGSNSTLVFHYFHDLAAGQEEFWESNKDVIELSLGPLLIDTSNMTQKVEDPDIKAFEFYKKVLASDTVNFTAQSNYNDFYKTLKTAKKDISGFSFADILRKDYKQFKFLHDDRVGFSSISKPLSWIANKFSIQDIKDDLSRTLKANQIELLVITASFTQKDTGIYTREFCYYYEGQNEKYAELYQLVWQQLELSTDLYRSEAISSLTNGVNDSGSHLKIYNQKKVTATRKQVVPIVKEVLEK